MNNKICKTIQGAATALSIAFASVAGGAIVGSMAYEGHAVATTGQTVQNQPLSTNELRLAVATMVGAGMAGYALGRINGALKP